MNAEKTDLRRFANFKESVQIRRNPSNPYPILF